MPSTLNDFAYGVNNPILHTDPSGEIAPIIAAMIAGGVISGGFELVSQLLSNSGNFHCLDWTSIGIAVGAGAIGGLFGFCGAYAATYIYGASFIGAILSGGLSGVAWGIGLRTTETAISGDWSSWQSKIFSPKSIAKDFTLGAATGFVGYSANLVRIAMTKKLLEKYAAQAVRNIGPGRGCVYGTRVHSEFSRLLKLSGNEKLTSEISYLSGRQVGNGIRGSIRIDVVYGRINRPIAVYDLKTGSATLKASRIFQLVKQLPKGRFPIIEIKP